MTNIYIVSNNFKGDFYYAFPTNKGQNSIQTTLVQKHIETTHSTLTSYKMPPHNTHIIETNITGSLGKKSNQKIDKHLRHQIIATCRDANGMMGTKHLDPALCLHLGAYLMCIDNKHLKDKVPRGNGS